MARCSGRAFPPTHAQGPVRLQDGGLADFLRRLREHAPFLNRCWPDPEQGLQPAADAQRPWLSGCWLDTASPQAIVFTGPACARLTADGGFPCDRGPPLQRLSIVSGAVLNKAPAAQCGFYLEIPASTAWRGPSTPYLPPRPSAGYRPPGFTSFVGLVHQPTAVLYARRPGGGQNGCIAALGAGGGDLLTCVIPCLPAQFPSVKDLWLKGFLAGYCAELVGPSGPEKVAGLFLQASSSYYEEIAAVLPALPFPAGRLEGRRAALNPAFRPT